MTFSVTLIIVIVTVFVSWRAFENSALFEKMLNNPYQVKHRKEYYRLVSHILVHGDYIHLALNMYVLYSFGQFVEMMLMAKSGMTGGRLLYLLLYVVGGAVATLPSLRKHGDNYGYNSVGASGAVSAVMMVAMLMMPPLDVNIRFFFILPLPNALAILVFFAIEHFMQRSGRTRIAHDAHIWGALFGILFVVLYDIHILERFFRELRLGLFG